MPSITPELSIVIVNWNGGSFLPACIKSIVDAPPRIPYEIVVVDNDSSDNSVVWLGSPAAASVLNGTKFTLIQSRVNLGFGRANNLAIEHTQSPFVLILNPDTLVKPGALDNLLAVLHSDDKIGLSVPKICGPDGKTQPSVWPLPNAMRFLADGLGIYKLLPKKLRGKWLLFNHWSYDAKIAVPLAAGCAMMARREMINDAGAFDPDIFMYGEDMEWCYRMGKRGWTVVFEPQAEVIHIGGQSSKQRWTLIESRMKEEQGWITFQQKCLSPFSALGTSTAKLLVISARYLVRKMSGKDTEFFDKLIPLYSSAVASAFLRLKAKLGRLPKRLKQDAKIIRLVENWREILAAKASNRPFFSIRFRNGVVINSPPQVALDFLVSEIWMDEFYNPPGYGIKAGENVVDIGANIGVFALWAATRAKQVRVLAYEPYPGNVEYFKSNLAQSGVDRVELYEMAVSDHSGKQTLRVDDSWIMHSLVPSGSGVRGVEVNCTTLDNVFTQIERCDFLKLDCEGGEYRILYGASEESLGKIGRIVCEFNLLDDERQNGDALREFLTSNGFKVEILKMLNAESGFICAKRKDD